jgi:hypothetical protein
MPMSMLGLGIVLVSAMTGKYGTAGAVAATGGPPARHRHPAKC